MLWMPGLAGIINGAGHYWGYRNYDTMDNSRNLLPIGFLIAGEELHNNHHGKQWCAKFSRKWFEFDVSWFYICMLEKFGLAARIRGD
jgi:stearoyl-CoA desaturase (delta-9 desaturase)